MITAQAPAKARVLFVDDEPRVLFSLKAIFRDCYEVTTAASGQAAMEVLRILDVDVVVSDQRMPGMTGIEVLRCARQLRPRAIRILLTGYSDLNATIGAINEGEVFRFITKPWSNQQLRETLAAAARASAVSQSGGAEATTAVAATREAQDSGIGVLVLESEPQMRAALGHALAGDHPVYKAAALDEGLTLLAQHRIGVIVTELLVDSEDLTSALGMLRQHDPSLVAIVLTGQADAERAIRLINQGQIYRLLRKPVSEQLLRGTVNLACHRFATLMQHPQLMRRHEVEPTPLPPAHDDKGSLVERIRRLWRR